MITPPVIAMAMIVYTAMMILPNIYGSSQSTQLSIELKKNNDFCQQKLMSAPLLKPIHMLYTYVTYHYNAVVI